MKRALPALLGVGLVVAFLHRLLVPDAVLAVRDIPFFHLPLREALARLATEGLPLWNPWLNGGQPVLSNPNYAAFYPLTWLLIVVPPYASINLLIVGHALLGFAGAWRFARHLGTGSAAAALAAVAFTGGGAFISSPNTLTLFCGLAWFPWVLLWGDRALEAGEPGADSGPRRSWLRPGLAAAMGVALQLLAGEPVVPLITALGLACLVLDRPRRTARRGARVAIILALACCLAAVQLVPTLNRIADSPRHGGLEDGDAATWSMSPERLIEWLLPRLFGDPSRGDENLYFGWGVHDRNFPYIISIYPGLLVLVLATAALIRWPIPRRRAWIAMLAIGLGLAFGRFNPLYQGIVARIPPFSLIRYPEKFVLLATTALPFAAALAWQRLLDRQREGRSEDADFPLALAVVISLVTGVWGAILSLRPEVGAWWIQRHTPLPLPPETLEAGAAYLRGETLLALLPAAISVAAFAVLRWRSRWVGAVAWLAVALLGAELWHYGQGLNATVPASQVLDPPPLARALPEEPGRLFTDLAFTERSEIVTRSRRAGPTRLRTSLDRLDPYSGLLWGLDYALHEDYDLMLTDWARFALRQLELSWERPKEARRILGAWGVSQRIRVQSLRRSLRRGLTGRRTPPAQLQEIRERLPIHRFTPQVIWHPDRETAVEAMVDAEFRVARGDHWVALEGATDLAEGRRRVLAARDTRLLEIVERSAGLELTYRASAPTLFVAAHTYHPGWQARIDGDALPVYPTALGQIGLELPAGEHSVDLRFGEPSLVWGAGITLATLLMALLTLIYRRPRGRGSGPEPAIHVESSLS